MLTKNVDMALVGKNYLSFIFSMELLERGEKVLLIDDGRFELGNLYVNYTCELEKKYLQLWGEDKGILPLADIDKYIVKRPLTLVIGSRYVSLGDTPLRNLTELARKLSFSFQSSPKDKKKSPVNLLETILNSSKFKENFNQDYKDYTQLLASRIYQMDSKKKYAVGNMFVDCPQSIKELYDAFSNYAQGIGPLSEDQLWEIRLFLYMSRGFFQENLSYNVEGPELFHLFLCLLSPLYELDHTRLLSDLLTIYRQRGGQYKETKINEWFFHNDRPWSIELASYEGIVMLKAMSLLGCPISSGPIHLRPELNSYACIKVYFKFSKKFSSGWQNRKVLFSDLERMGTSRPIWESSFYKDEMVSNVFIENQKGLKISFIKEEIKKMLQEDLETLMPEFSTLIIEENYRFSSEIWMVENDKQNLRNANLGTIGEIGVYNSSISGKFSKLKDVHYFGPYKRGPLGLLSTLNELKCFN